MQFPLSGLNTLLFALEARLSLDMWYSLSNNASNLKMFGYNLYPTKKQERLLNEAFEGCL